MHFNDFISNYRFKCELMPPRNSRLAKMRRERIRREREEAEARRDAFLATGRMDARARREAADEHAPGR